jgi:hypothetical protein
MTTTDDSIDPAAEIAKWPDAASVASHMPFNHSKYPANTFRNAWRYDGNGGIAHDIPTCQALLRAQRDVLLAQLDAKATTWQRAAQQSNSAKAAAAAANLKAVNARAQQLRDTPQQPQFSTGNVNDLITLYNGMIISDLA